MQIVVLLKKKISLIYCFNSSDLKRRCSNLEGRSSSLINNHKKSFFFPINTWIVVQFSIQISYHFKRFYQLSYLAPLQEILPVKLPNTHKLFVHKTKMNEGQQNKSLCLTKYNNIRSMKTYFWLGEWVSIIVFPGLEFNERD